MRLWAAAIGDSGLRAPGIIEIIGARWTRPRGLITSWASDIAGAANIVEKRLHICV